MEKDTRLINIYLKIHHKKILTMDDLAYLAAYDPECFEKTCKNVVYNMPEIKPIMEPAVAQTAQGGPKPEPSERQKIETILENLKRFDIDDFSFADIDTDKVKSLLGNLYMELLFPHNDAYTFIEAAGQEATSTFDKKA